MAREPKNVPELALCYLSIITQGITTSGRVQFKVSMDIGFRDTFQSFPLGEYKYAIMPSNGECVLANEILEDIVNTILTNIERTGYRLSITKDSIRQGILICSKSPESSMNIYTTIVEFPKSEEEIDEDNCQLLAYSIPSDEKYLISLITPKRKSLFEKIMSWRFR